MATASATDSSRADHYYYHDLRQRPQPRHDNGRFGFDAGCFGFGFDADRFAFDAPAEDNDRGNWPRRRERWSAVQISSRSALER